MTTPGPIRSESCPRPNIGPNTMYADFAIPNPPCYVRSMEQDPCVNVRQEPLLPPRQYYMNVFEPVAFAGKGKCDPK